MEDDELSRLISYENGVRPARKVIISLIHSLIYPSDLS